MAIGGHHVFRERMNGFSDLWMRIEAASGAVQFTSCRFLMRDDWKHRQKEYKDVIKFNSRVVYALREKATQPKHGRAMSKRTGEDIHAFEDRVLTVFGSFMTSVVTSAVNLSSTGDGARIEETTEPEKTFSDDRLNKDVPQDRTQDAEVTCTNTSTPLPPIVSTMLGMARMPCRPMPRICRPMLVRPALKIMIPAFRVMMQPRRPLREI